jgi:1,4-alpha-glucan branching enzyme
MSGPTKTSGPAPGQPADPDITRLLEARLHDPRRVLGLHPAGAGTETWRALLPYAQRAALVEPPLPLTRRNGSALFEWTGRAGTLHAPLRLRWHDHDGRSFEQIDPYTLPLQLADEDLERFGRGEHVRAWQFLGATPRSVAGLDGTLFAVWAPNAERVSVVGNFNRWDGRCHPMTVRGGSGVWELFIPGIGADEVYKYEIRNREHGVLRVKSDPYGRRFELRPATASITTAPPAHVWRDADWIARRASVDWLREPISIYELHVGSWRRGPGHRFLDWHELARELGPYARDLGFTHVELLPITEHPFDDSWGYQSTGYFAPTSRFGNPEGLRAFVDEMHRQGLGVLLDWVPGHFPRDDFALARFDGAQLYEYGDRLKGEHPDWDTLVFDFDRKEVRSFLLSSALYWLEEFHFDGLRVDAVASMLYLDYSRRHGQWSPNVFGGNENLEAITFLRRLNEVTHGEAPGTLTMAEESTAWPGVSRPTFTGGLGFTFKWNMGWMHDTLSYMHKDPVHRRFHHNLITFGPIYAFSENFVLPLSHDEVVHGKGSLLNKMPGDDWQRFANLRLLYAFQWTYPGKKLLFMGQEFGQPWEWNHHDQLPWQQAEQPAHAGISALVRDLNRLYRNEPALHRRDVEGDGFRWLSWEDSDNSVLSWLRLDEHAHVAVVLNATPVPREGYRIGVPAGAGHYVEIFNSDSRYYGGGDIGNPVPLSVEPVPAMGYTQSVVLTVPPLACVVLAPR